VHTYICTYTLPPRAANMFLSHGHSFADASECGIQKTLHQIPSRSQDVYLTRGMVLLYIYTYMHCTCVLQRAAAAAEHFVNFRFFFLYFYCRLHLLFSARRVVLMGSSTTTAAARNSTAFAPFPRPALRRPRDYATRRSSSLTVYHVSVTAVSRSTCSSTQCIYTYAYNVYYDHNIILRVCTASSSAKLWSSR